MTMFTALVHRLVKRCNTLFISVDGVMVPTEADAKAWISEKQARYSNEIMFRQILETPNVPDVRTPREDG